MQNQFKLKTLESPETHFLFFLGLIKFFGGLARNHPKEVLSRFDHFIRLVLSNVSEGDQIHRGVSVDTIGFIALTPEGKLALEKIGKDIPYHLYYQYYHLSWVSERGCASLLRQECGLLALAVTTLAEKKKVCSTM